jgi:hypothetical protein
MNQKLTAENKEFIDKRMREFGEALERRLEEECSAKLAKLEAAFLDRLGVLEADLAAKPAEDGPTAGQTLFGAGMGAPLGIHSGGADQAENALALCRSQGARLSLLEESFARICNHVGRLDMELELLQDEVSKPPRG